MAVEREPADHVSRSYTEKRGRGVESGWSLGPRQPPTPEPLPQTPESVRISNLGCFHFHTPTRQWGQRGLRTSGSVSWAMMGKASSATQIGPHPTPSPSPRRKAAECWGVGLSTRGSVGCPGPLLWKPNYVRRSAETKSGATYVRCLEYSNS